jgi:hypothetical protein
MVGWREVNDGGRRRWGTGKEESADAPSERGEGNVRQGSWRKGRHQTFTIN